jgi:ubiquinone/menaquinone biosynthesis C-methylase UbiE
MDTQSAYDKWAPTYDTVVNKTRDLELIAGQQMLSSADFSKVLETGCGTGKNTSWISKRTTNLVAVDFSEGMLALARQKIKEDHVKFQQFDLTRPWNFNKVSLIICSLVLEHIDNIEFIFEQAAKTLECNGCFYICELHPYKQLEGSRAKFEHGNQMLKLEYFVHHIADFYSAALKNGMNCIDMKEWFDENDKRSTPRLISFLFQKQH